MTTLLLVRHGQTDWNAEGRIQGTTDIPLNDTGREQARAAGEALRSRMTGGSALVVSSDLARAGETGRIIADVLGAEDPRTYAGLRERAYGEAEGMDAGALRDRFGDLHGADIPSAEPWPEVRRRALCALRVVAREARARTAPASTPVVVVSHGALIRELIRHASAGDLPRPGERLDNGSITTVRWERDRMTLLDYPAVVRLSV